MTTSREMETAYAAQQQIIAALREIDDLDLADRLERCMQARQDRHYGDGWPYSCRSAACFWCRRAMIRGWWFGMREWSSATASSLAIIGVLSPIGLPEFYGSGVVYEMSETGWLDAGNDGARWGLRG
jgi:hypothetical protein